MMSTPKIRGTNKIRATPKLGVPLNLGVGTPKIKGCLYSLIFPPVATIFLLFILFLLNPSLSKPITPTKDYVFKQITPIEKPRPPIKCSLCLDKITHLKSKKGYKIHLAKFHKNEAKPDLKAVPDDPEVHCMLEKKGIRCTKSYDLDQIYR